MRLYAAGPSINIIATYLALLLLSAAATGLVASSPGVYASGIIADEGAEEGGLLPYEIITCLLYTSPSPRDKRQSRMPSSA